MLVADCNAGDRANCRATTANTKTATLVAATGLIIERQREAGVRLATTRLVHAPLVPGNLSTLRNSSCDTETR